MSGGIDHKSSPFESWFIFNQNGNSFNIVLTIVLFEYLGIGLEPSQKTNILISKQFPLVGSPDKKLIKFLFSFKGWIDLVSSDYDIEGIVRVLFFLAIEDV